MTDRYSALVEADSIITFELPDDVDDDEESIEAYLEKSVRTGHLGPVNVRTIEEDPFQNDTEDDDE